MYLLPTDTYIVHVVATGCIISHCTLQKICSFFSFSIVVRLCQLLFLLIISECNVLTTDEMVFVVKPITNIVY